MTHTRVCLRPYNIIVRRKCPGRHFALEGALIAVASILSCFDITQSLEDKADISVNDPTKPFMSSGLTS